MPGMVPAGLIARRHGHDIVMEGRLSDGTPIRWRYESITPASFHYTAEKLGSDGESWQLYLELFGKRSNPRLPSAQQKLVVTLLALCQLGYAHWFFGNLYEAVVRIPDRLAKDYEPGVEDRRLPSVLSLGSPLRYYLPGIPVVIGATLSALVAGWRSRDNRLLLGAAAVSAFSGVAATIYQVSAVNLKLFVAGQAVTPPEQDRLLRVWYRVNAFRLLTTGSAWLIAARLASRLCSLSKN